MYPTNSGIPTVKPTIALKRMDKSSCPEVNFLSEADFKKFIPSGISVKIETPLEKVASNALFGVNIDGFTPPFNISPNCFGKVMKNLFPVKVVTGITNVQVSWQMSGIPEMVNYLSNRVVAGNVGIGVRCTSNTSQPGNFIVAQASGMARKFYPAVSVDQGLTFQNGSTSALDYSYDSFELADLSLNRNFSITPVRRDPLVKMDLAQKLNFINSFNTPATLAPDSNRLEIFENQFLEDWILIDILNTLPSTNTNEVYLDLFFDYSRVEFYTGMLPFLPIGPYDFAGRIMDVNKTVAQDYNFNQAQIVIIPDSNLDKLKMEETSETCMKKNPQST
jgi:type 1 fimbria pilin